MMFLIDYPTEISVNFGRWARPAKCHYRKDSEEKRIAVYTYVS